MPDRHDWGEICTNRVAQVDRRVNSGFNGTKCRGPERLPMIEVDSYPDEHVVKVRLRGIVTIREFTDLAAIIADFGSGIAVLVYLDWVGVERWEFAVASANGVIGWRR